MTFLELAGEAALVGVEMPLLSFSTDSLLYK